MNEHTKVALTQAGFAPWTPQSNAVPPPKSIGYPHYRNKVATIVINEFANTANLQCAIDNLPLILAALTTPTADAKRIRDVVIAQLRAREVIVGQWHILNRDDLWDAVAQELSAPTTPFALTDEERAILRRAVAIFHGESETIVTEMYRLGTAILALLARSESASPEQMRDFTADEAVRHAAFARSKGRVVLRDVFGVGTPPEPSLTDEVERPTLVRLDDALTVLDAILTEGVTDKRAIIQQMARRVPTLPDAPPDPPNLDIRAHTPEADEIWATVAKAAERCPAWIRPHVERISRQIGAEIKERLLQKYAPPESLTEHRIIGGTDYGSMQTRICSCGWQSTDFEVERRVDEHFREVDPDAGLPTAEDLLAAGLKMSPILKPSALTEAQLAMVRDELRYLLLSEYKVSAIKAKAVSIDLINRLRNGGAL